MYWLGFIKLGVCDVILPERPTLQFKTYADLLQSQPQPDLSQVKTVDVISAAGISNLPV